MKILIADDHPVTRKMLESQLRRWGYDVVVCSDGTSAWEALKQENSPRLVVLDWMMPGMNGIDICRELRRLERQPYMYIILLTSRNSKEDVVKGLEAGADDYVIKPFDPNELQVRIRAGARIVQLQEDLLSALRVSEFQASHDALTRLWNRATILQTLDRELARAGRDSTSVGLLVVDIDHFKAVNDQFGHLAGDAVLREVARRMLQVVRPYDSVGRYGGEEFLVILPNCDTNGTLGMAERLRVTIGSTPLTTPEGMFHVTVSIGVTAIEAASNPEAEKLIAAADEALYRAKDLGRNRVEVSNGKRRDRPASPLLAKNSLATGDGDWIAPN